MDLTLVLTLVALALLVTVLVTVGLALVLARASASQRRALEDLGASRAELAALRERVDQLGAARGSAPTHEGEEFVITGLPAEPRPAGTALAPEQGLPGDSVETRAAAGRDFVTVAVAESVVRALSLVHGLRRAASAETRHRIRFEVRREVKRSRKQRRAELREARRWLRSRPTTEADGPSRVPGVRVAGSRDEDAA